MCTNFLKGLCEHLKDEIATRDEPDSLRALFAFAICVVNRARERQKASLSPNSKSPKKEPMQL